MSIYYFIANLFFILFYMNFAIFIELNFDVYIVITRKKSVYIAFEWISWIPGLQVVKLQINLNEVLTQ